MDSVGRLYHLLVWLCVQQHASSNRRSCHEVAQGLGAPYLMDVCSHANHRDTHLMIATPSHPYTPCHCRLTLPPRTHLKVKVEHIDSPRHVRSCDQGITIQQDTLGDSPSDVILCHWDHQQTILCSEESRTFTVKYFNISQFVISFQVSRHSWLDVQCGLVPPRPGQRRLLQVLPTTSTYSHSTTSTWGVPRTTSPNPLPSSHSTSRQPTSTQPPPSSPAASTRNTPSSPAAGSTRYVMPTVIVRPRLEPGKTRNSRTALSSGTRDTLRSSGFIAGAVVAGIVLLVVMISTAVVSYRSYRRRLSHKRYDTQRLILEGSVIESTSTDTNPPGSSAYGSVFHVTTPGHNDQVFTY